MPSFPNLKRFFAVVLFICTAQAPIAQAALLSLQPDSTFAANGDSVSLDLVVSGLGDFDPDSLGAFDISMAYDTAALSFTGYSLDSFLGDLGFFEASDSSIGDTGGTINLAEISFLSSGDLDALQPDEFILASLTFDVLDLAVGATTNVAFLRSSTLADAPGSALEITGARSATIEGRSSVPAPGTLLLLLSGLLGAGLIRQLARTNR